MDPACGPDVQQHVIDVATNSGETIHLARAFFAQLSLRAARSATSPTPAAPEHGKNSFGAVLHAQHSFAFSLMTLILSLCIRPRQERLPTLFVSMPFSNSIPMLMFST
jgi:hypothetical protein